MEWMGMDKGKGKGKGKLKGKGKMKGKDKGKVPTQPGATVFIYHVPSEWDEDELARHFFHCGRIASCELARNADGENRGFGFISFEDPEGAKKARIGMNNFPAAPGKFLDVGIKKGEEQHALPLPNYPGSGRLDQPMVFGRKAPPGANIFVFHLPTTWTSEDLRRHFIQCGPITDLQVMMKADTQESRGFGFVGFESPLSAQRAVDGMQGFKTAEGKFLKVGIKSGEEEHAAAAAASLKVPGFALQAVSQRGLNGGDIYDEARVQDTIEEVSTCATNAAVQAIQESLITAFGLSSPLPADGWAALAEQAARLAVSEAFLHASEMMNASGDSSGADVPVAAAATAPGNSKIVLQGPWAAEQQQQSWPSQPRKRARVTAVPEGANLYIWNVPSTWDDAKLQEHFAAFGNIVSAVVMRHPDGQGRGFAFVGFDDVASANAAIVEMDGFKTPEGKMLSVQVKSNTKSC
eukprot:TRINITY_DN3976_c0_g1_i3.p1 TRINITY_DN3976_c0_g1~~TRINITY_DN3976_c0_g1_i3.p1  ORF type:complete len:532 (+),score=143.42 TRINITY_DN3976_c0_g1_i3:205-1596(+)